MKSIFSKFFLILLAAILTTGSSPSAANADQTVRCLTGLIRSGQDFTAEISIRYEADGIYVSCDDEGYQLSERYNLDGLLCEDSFFGPDGEILYTTSYTYDESGRLLRLHPVAPDGAARGDHIYTYDEQGRLKVYETFSPSGLCASRDECFYSESGMLLREDHYNHTGQLSLYYEYSTDEASGALRKDYYTVNADGTDTLQGYWIETSDNQGRLISSVWNHQSDSTNWTGMSYYYTYDESGRLISFERTGFDLDESNQYIYDADGYLSAIQYLIDNAECRLHYEDLTLEDAVASAASRWSRDLYPARLLPGS